MTGHEASLRAHRALRRHGALALLLIVVAVLAVSLHRNGHNWGDDFTLYLRQAKGLVDGNVGQVIADNHFNVDNAAKPGFSPYVYPWGFPLLLAPFFRLWGLDYGKLKLVEVACFCAFLGFFHALLRRRMRRWAAFSVVAAIGISLPYLLHTDQLLSEFPYMLAAAATLWWLDRCRRDHPLDGATRNQLIALGLLAVAVFNVRREGLAIVPAIMAVQLLEIRGRWRTVNWRRVATPHVTFLVGVVLFQLLLPSAIAPSYVNSGLGQTWKKLGGPFRVAFAQQLGFNHLRGFWLLIVFLVVVAGALVRMARHARDDIALLVFAVLSMVIVGMIPANADRYMLAITPFAIYFFAQAVAAAPWPRQLHGCAVIAVFIAFSVFHITQLPGPIRSARDFDATGAVVDGPESPYAQDAFRAVRTYTHEGDVVAFFKARALTFYTDRRSVQSSDLDILRQRADYFMMRRDSSYSQPDVSVEQGQQMGWVQVWSDQNWILWRVRPLSG